MTPSAPARVGAEEGRSPMARPGPTTFAKRQREMRKRQRRQEKLERRAQRKIDKEQAALEAPENTTGEDPDIAGIVPGPQPLPDWDD